MTAIPPRLNDLPTPIPPVRPTRLEPEPEPSRGAPVHPLAALLLLAVDNLWNLADWAIIDWIITIPLSFLTVFFPVLVIQRFVRKDRPGRAFALALALGVVAAIPTSLTGTPVGVALLAWFGIDKLIHRPAPSPAAPDRFPR